MCSKQNRLESLVGSSSHVLRPSSSKRTHEERTDPRTDGRMARTIKVQSHCRTHDLKLMICQILASDNRVQIWTTDLSDITTDFCPNVTWTTFCHSIHRISKTAHPNLFTPWSRLQYTGISFTSQSWNLQGQLSSLYVYPIRTFSTRMNARDSFPRYGLEPLGWEMGSRYIEIHAGWKQPSTHFTLYHYGFASCLFWSAIQMSLPERMICQLGAWGSNPRPTLGSYYQGLAINQRTDRQTDRVKSPISAKKTIPC